MGTDTERDTTATGAEQTLERRLRQQSAVASLGQRALAFGGFDELLWFAVSLVHDVLEVEKATVFGVEPDAPVLKMRAGLGFSEPTRSIRVPIEGTQLGLAITTRLPVLVADLEEDDRFPASNHLRELGLRSGLIVHIDDADGVFGALAVQSESPNQFTPDDVDFMTAMGAILGQARRRSVAEERLAYQAQIVAATIDPLIATDLELRITAWNAAAESLYGWSAAEAIGRGPGELLYDGEATPQLAAGREQLERDGKATFTVEQRTKDGRRIRVDCHAQAVTDRAGARIGYVAVNHDVTHRYELERRLLEAEKLDAVGRLAGGIAHDFNNALTAIRGYAFVSGRKADDAEAVRGYAAKIVDAADGASSVVRQLLAFSRRQVMQPRRVDVDEHLRALVPILRTLVGEDVELSVELACGGAVMIDPVLFDQALLNVVTNAREAMPRGGSLTIRSDEVTLPGDEMGVAVGLPEGRYCSVVVTDTGSGIEAEALDRVFEPFFSTKPEGSGLGLPTVHGIVTQSLGRVVAGNALGGGAEIAIYLPLADDEPVETAAEAGIKAEGANERVLVIEDDPIVRELTELVLSDRGYDVVTAADGDEALQVEGPIDLVVSDVILPRMRGTEVVERLRKDRPGLRAIFISGYAEGTIVDRGVLEPGVDFLEKPFAPDELTALVRVVLDRP